MWQVPGSIYHDLVIIMATIATDGTCAPQATVKLPGRQDSRGSRVRPVVPVSFRWVYMGLGYNRFALRTEPMVV
jgi:hypothetical protein